MLRDQRAQHRRVRGELPPFQGLKRRGDRQQRVGKRQADRLLPKVEPHQALTRSEHGLKFGKIGLNHRDLVRLPALGTIASKS